MANNYIYIAFGLMLITTLYDIFKNKWIFKPINGGLLSGLVYAIDTRYWLVSLLLLLFFYGFGFWRLKIKAQHNFPKKG
ncbi:hypothetical protein D5F52_04000 [Brevibacillus laterosporus]|uniref:hypothetical protein n=1 Tax=Brevibacillus laterosporus TaxID=1465 RepID=UPI000E6CD224|nr:hypothetical protein D5F52_04000 [Brevibacillus laterosporus]MBM7111527.1 hypothetical protein [Brevibacillus laterosporus]